jgi:hypothetical protein
MAMPNILNGRVGHMKLLLMACMSIAILFALPKLSNSTTEPDKHEPDNTMTQAKDIFFGYDQLHNFHAYGDIDWIRFPCFPNVWMNVWAHNTGPRCDVVLDLFDSSGKFLIGADSGSYAEPENLIWSCQDNGLYYARVKQYNKSDYGVGTSYSLQVRIEIGEGLCFLQGPVKDASTGRPVPGAVVSTQKTNYLGSTSSQGNYSMAIEVPDQGILEYVTAQKAGYARQTLQAQLADSTRPVVKQFALKPIRVLVLTEVTAPSTAEHGRDIKVFIRVKNKGRADSGSFNVRIYLSADAKIEKTRDRLLGFLTVAGLKAGETTPRLTAVVKVPADVLPNTYYIGAIAANTNARACATTTTIR